MLNHEDIADDLVEWDRDDIEITPIEEFCEGCGEHHSPGNHRLVWCATVRRMEGPQAINTEPDDIGAVLGLEQCDECGSSTYEIVEGRKIRCSDTEFDEVTYEGCGRLISIVRRPAPEVVF